ncbi:helix-turn-helix domain-containing protein [Capnocytophaga sp. ARDL2]
MLIGEKVFELRKKRGLSQENLALDLGLSQSTISNYEIHSNF